MYRILFLTISYSFFYLEGKKKKKEEGDQEPRKKHLHLKQS